MYKQDWDSMNDLDFEAMLEDSVSQLAPEDVVAGVTPWRKAMNRVLVGMALGAVTLNFLYLQYLLPAIGMVLTLLGFRSLRHENRPFQICFLITVFRSVHLFATLILNTTILQSMAYATPVMTVLSAFDLSLLFVQYFCFWRGLRAVQRKAGLPPRAGGAIALVVWYALLCLLAHVRYNGLVIAAGMVIGYFFIIRSLYMLSKELDKAGYAVQTKPAKIADRAIVTAICVALLIGGTCGYMFGGSYPMDWSPASTAEHSEAEDIKAHLAELGFPEYVLDDLTAEEILACGGALQIVTDVHDHPVNDGRTMITRRPGEPGSGIDVEVIHETVYDVKELRITGVGVQIPGERETWMIFQHFLWTTDPGFSGTESIQLWPPYHHHGEGWGSAGDVSGRVLYDKDGVTYTAPYHSLGKETFTSDSLFWGEQTSTDLFATFSMPGDGESHRGYVAYPIVEMQDGWITDCWINYTHQSSRLQYPVLTAMEMRMKNSWSTAGVFRTVQDALQFYANEDGAELLFSQDN